MDKTPFTVYDFFAYLSSGAVLVITADYTWGLGLLTRKEVNTVLGVVLIILAYVSGQMVAHFSSFLLEQNVVARLLKRPSTLLLGGKPGWAASRWIFPNYHRPLPELTQRRVREQASARGCSAEGEGLFLHAYSIVTGNDRLQARLDDFRNQYGFARNMALAFLLSAVTVTVARWYGQPVRLRWAVLGTMAGATLFYRYLKFFRQFSYELFLRYAELPHPDTKTESPEA